MLHPDNLATMARRASATATGEVVAAPGHGLRVAVLQVFATTDSSGGTVQFDDGTNPVSEEHALAAGAVIPFTGCPWFMCPPNTPLEVTITGNVAVEVAYALV